MNIDKNISEEEKEKIPLICKVKDKLNLLPRSPVASLIYCRYGFRHRPIKKCRNCPKSYIYLMRKAEESIEANYKHIPDID